MLGGADNPNGELLSYIIGADIGPPGTFFYHGGFGYNGAFRTYDWYRGKLSVKAGIKFLLRHACGQRPRKASSPKAHEHTTNC